ncbi:unnamed protein product [Moneuplotes crassus]|uniref:Uncharacterized protein n=1 Tax=Euplotes crassus TaxID=5936 RepID=A0AAD1UHG4_EUPCR|nr:unnamed protein product [Moneuplotes crassus]
MNKKFSIGSSIRRRLKKNFNKSNDCESDDSEPLPPKDDGRTHVNWAKDLERIYDFEESKKTIVTKNSLKAESCKSILKIKVCDPCESEETECSSEDSSTGETCEHRYSTDTNRSPSKAKKKTSVDIHKKKELSSYTYSNKKFLSEILATKGRRLSSSSLCKSKRNE